MCNKDFLRQIISGDKELIPMNAVKMVDVPTFDELSVSNLWPHLKKDQAFMRHFPDELPKGRLPTRDYFFNILNTGMGDYLKDLIRHANAQRNSANGEAMQRETIVVSNAMMEQLNNMPHISSKSPFF